MLFFISSRLATVKSILFISYGHLEVQYTPTGFGIKIIKILVCISYIYATYMSSFSNPDPRHSDLIEGAVTTELPRQPLWSNSNISYKVYLDLQAFSLRHLGLGITHSTVVATVAQWVDHLP